MNCQVLTSIQPLIKVIAAVAMIVTTNIILSNEAEEKTKLEFVNCEWCNRFTETQISYFAGLSWLNGDYLHNNRELNYREPFDFIFGYNSRYWNDDLLSTLGINYLNENNQSLSISFKKPGEYRFKIHRNSLLWYTVDSQISPYSRYGGDMVSLPGGWQPIEATSDLTASNIKFQDFESTSELLRQGMSFDYTPKTNWHSGLELDSTNYKSQQLHAGSLLTTATFFPLQRDFTNDQLTTYLAYQTDQWQFKSSYLLSLLQNQYVTTFWENPFLAINNSYRDVPFSQKPDNKFHQLALSYVNQLTPRQRLQLNGAWGKGSQDDYLAQPFSPRLGYGASLSDSYANLKVNTSNIRVNYSNRVTNDIKVNYRFRIDERTTNHNALTHQLWSGVNNTGNNNFNFLYPRNLDYQKKNHNLDFNWRINNAFRLLFNNKWSHFDRLEDSVKSDESKHLIRLNIMPAANYDISLSAGKSQRDGRINWYYWDTTTSFEERHILSRFHANEFNRVQWRITNNWVINSNQALFIDYQKQRDRYPDTSLGIEHAKHSITHIEYHYAFSNSVNSSIFIDRELSRSNQVGGIEDYSLSWSSGYRDDIFTAGLNISYLTKSSEWQYKLTILDSDFSGDQSTQSVLNEEPFPTIKRKQSTIKFEPTYQLNPKTTLSMLYQYERLNNRDWQQDLLAVDEVPKLIPPTLIAPEYNIHFFAVKINIKI